MRLLLRKHADISLAEYRSSVKDIPILVNIGLNKAREEGGILINKFIDTMMSIPKVRKRSEDEGIDNIVINAYQEFLLEDAIPKFPGELWSCPFLGKYKEYIFWMTASSEPTGVSHLQFIDPGKLIVDKQACTWGPQILSEYIAHINHESLFLQDGLIIEVLNQSPVRARRAFKPGNWAAISWSYAP